MAKPRVFISSTFYDLKQIRVDIDQFLKSLGYESVRNEEGSIPYGKEEKLESYCYKEIPNCDILISIIGGRFGSESKQEASIDKKLSKTSVSQEELKRAIELQKQVYIFIDKNVSAEYQTYLLNKDLQGVKYKFVDDPRIYTFIEEVKNLGVNNNIKDFETSEDITNYLREQFAGLFQRYIDEHRQIKEYSLIAELERTSNNLKQVVDYVSNINKEHKNEIDQILMLNHPLVNWIRNVLGIKYNIYILGLEDLNSLLSSWGYINHGIQDHDGKSYYSWYFNYNNGSTRWINIAKSLFNDDGSLINILPVNWKKEMAISQLFEPTPPFDFNSNYSDPDLPF